MIRTPPCIVGRAAGVRSVVGGALARPGGRLTGRPRNRGRAASTPYRVDSPPSRAQCLCVLVASPMVFEADCRTPEQMRLANAYCRYLELAQRPTLRSLGESAVPSYAFEDAA